MKANNIIHLEELESEVNIYFSIIALMLSYSVVNFFFFFNFFDYWYWDEQPDSIRIWQAYLIQSAKTSYLSFEKWHTKLRSIFCAIQKCSALITSSITLRKWEAAIVKFSTPAIMTLCKVITRRYDAVLNQSECAHLFNHWRNYTKAKLSQQYVH